MCAKVQVVSTALVALGASSIDRQQNHTIFAYFQQE